MSTYAGPQQGAPGPILRFAVNRDPAVFDFIKFTKFLYDNRVGPKDIGYLFEADLITFFFLEVSAEELAYRLINTQALADLQLCLLVKKEAQDAAKLKANQIQNRVLVKSRNSTPLDEFRALEEMKVFGQIVFYEPLNPREMLVKYYSKKSADRCLEKGTFSAIFLVEPVGRAPVTIMNATPKGIQPIKLSHSLLTTGKLSLFEDSKIKLTKSDENDLNANETVRTFGINSVIHTQPVNNFDEVFNSNPSGSPPPMAFPSNRDQSIGPIMNLNQGTFFDDSDEELRESFLSDRPRMPGIKKPHPSNPQER